jgi:DNA-binding NarL/FixJ family response regulator
VTAVATTDVPPHRPTLDDEDRRLLELLAEGLPLEAIARHLKISERTVRRRIRSLCDRIGVGNPVQAVVWAVRVGIL